MWLERYSFSSMPTQKRQGKLETAITETQPTSTIHKLKDLCRTRWVQRLDAFTTFSSLYESTLVCLETICEEGSKLWSSDSIADAHTLQQAICHTNFIAGFVISNECLQYLRSLTVNHQGSSMDIITAVTEIDTVTSTLKASKTASILTIRNGSIK